MKCQHVTLVLCKFYIASFQGSMLVGTEVALHFAQFIQYDLAVRN